MGEIILGIERKLVNRSSFRVQKKRDEIYVENLSNIIC